MSDTKLPSTDAIDWRKVPAINAAQIGGIETSVLDNGPGRGVRIAWVNTGGGLRYKVLLDRGLDIADAEFLGQSLTWHSFGGVTTPRPAYSKGLDWLRGFYGGLMVGCGPLNTGGPFEEEGEQFGLHGTHSNTPATVESIINPNLRRGEDQMSITGIVRTARVFGPNIELRRTISSKLGVPSIQVTDLFTNYSNTTVPLQWLHHINLGYPLLEPNASVFCWHGKESPLPGCEEWYSSANDFKAVVGELDSHRGTGEVSTYIDPEPDSQGNVTCGVVNRKRGFGLKVEFSLREFARLINWQHWGPGGSYAAALEPSNAGVESRPLDVKRGWLQQLEPGESRTFHCQISATNDPAVLQGLLDLNK